MITANAIVDILTAGTPLSRTVDEIRHTGGAGTSFVERWRLDNGEHRTQSDVPYLWRVMYRAPGEPGRRWLHWERGVRVAYGIAATLEDATLEGRKEARRLAKGRRRLAKQDWTGAADLPINSALEGN